jgi:hypothetical protein
VYPKSFKELKYLKEKEKNTVKKKNKVFKAILVPEFDTDDSMKGIKYDDILSEDS